MSEEDSFVILGSKSPMSSLEDDVNYASMPPLVRDDDCGSNFDSLRQSQLYILEDARKSTVESIIERMPSLMQQSNIKNQIPSSNGRTHATLIDFLDGPYCKQNTNDTINNLTDEQTEPDFPFFVPSVNQMIWSHAAQFDKNINKELNSDLQNLAISSLSNIKKQQKEDINVPQQKASILNSTVLEKTTDQYHGHTNPFHVSAKNSLAESFLMGEISADVLKTSVFSQFPSISVHSSAEDVEKLQNMVTENSQLKVILEKVNSTMRFFHSSSLQWQEKVNNMETRYKQKLNECQNEIEMLRKENKTLQDDLKTQIEALEVGRQKDREETIKEISEKNSLVENMRAQIIKLEQRQQASIEVLEQSEKTKNEFGIIYISLEEHNFKIKGLERQLSELYASNLDLKDLEKQYIDELNCLKVNLASAEELMRADRAAILQLQLREQEREARIAQLTGVIENLRLTIDEQNERILMFQQQNEVYRKDFEMEQERRKLATVEKQHMLQDLKNLQKRNQELIEEHQKFVDNYEERLKASQTSYFTHQKYLDISEDATNFDNPQRPIRNLPSDSSNSQATLQSCPICHKTFKSLTILQSHVNDCIDKN